MQQFYEISFREKGCSFDLFGRQCFFFLSRNRIEARWKIWVVRSRFLLKLSWESYQKELDDFSRPQKSISRDPEANATSRWQYRLDWNKISTKTMGYKAWKPACVQEKRLPEEQRGSDSRRPSVSSLQNTRFSSCGKILRRKRFSVSLALNISARPRSLAGSRRLDLFKASNFPRAKNARPKHL